MLIEKPSNLVKRNFMQREDEQNEDYFTGLCTYYGYVLSFRINNIYFILLIIVLKEKYTLFTYIEENTQRPM